MNFIVGFIVGIVSTLALIGGILWTVYLREKAQEKDNKYHPEHALDPKYSEVKIGKKRKFLWMMR